MVNPKSQYLTELSTGQYRFTLETHNIDPVAPIAVNFTDTLLEDSWTLTIKSSIILMSSFVDASRFGPSVVSLVCRPKTDHDDAVSSALSRSYERTVISGTSFTKSSFSQSAVPGLSVVAVPAATA